jgi:predicted amino acid dehydrogenase
MGAALSDPLWMASLGNEQAVMVQEWTREALQKMADDMVVKRMQGRAREHPTFRRFLTRHMASARVREYSRAVVVVVMQLQQTVKT